MLPYFAILLALIFSFLLAQVAGDNRIRRTGQLTILVIASALIGLEWAFDFFAYMNSRFNAVFGWMHWLGYPLAYLMVVGIIFCLLALRPAWQNRRGPTAWEKRIGNISFSRYSMIPILCMTLVLGIVLDIEEWHQAEMAKATLNNEEVVARAKGELENDFMVRLASAQRPTNFFPIHLKVQREGQEALYIYMPGYSGEANKLDRHDEQSPYTIAPIDVCETFYAIAEAEVDGREVRSELVSFQIPSDGSMPTLAVGWKDCNGGKEPYPLLLQ